MSVLTDRTKHFSTPKDPKESLGQRRSETSNSSQSGKTEVVPNKQATTQPHNVSVSQFTGITREERDRNIESSILAGIEGGKDFTHGAWQWFKSGFGYNLTDGRYVKALDLRLRPSSWYTVQFTKDIIATGKQMAAQNKSTSYIIGTTTAALTEAMVMVTVAKPFLTLSESAGKLSWPIVKNIGIKFVKTFVKKAK